MTSLNCRPWIGISAGFSPLHATGSNAGSGPGLCCRSVAHQPAGFGILAEGSLTACAASAAS